MYYIYRYIVDIDYHNALCSTQMQRLLFLLSIVSASAAPSTSASAAALPSAVDVTLGVLLTLRTHATVEPQLEAHLQLWLQHGVFATPPCVAPSRELITNFKFIQHFFFSAPWPEERIICSPP